MEEDKPTKGRCRWGFDIRMKAPPWVALNYHEVYYEDGSECACWQGPSLPIGDVCCGTCVYFEPED